MRTASTSISELKIRGETRYRVTYPTVDGRKRELYVDPKKAEKRLKEVKEDQMRFGLSVTAMTSTTRADAAAAEKILAGSGLTLVEVARAMLEQKKQSESGVSISEAVEAFMQSRDSRAAAYLRTLRPRMKYISDFFAERTSTSIKFDDCQQLLDGLAGTSSQRSSKPLDLPEPAGTSQAAPLLDEMRYGQSGVEGRHGRQVPVLQRHRERRGGRRSRHRARRSHVPVRPVPHGRKKSPALGAGFF